MNLIYTPEALAATSEAPLFENAHLAAVDL
jgi:hypothetical protein